VDDQSWEHVKELFHQALKRPTEERRGFLDAACGGDAALRAEVEALLDSHDEIGDESLSSDSRRAASREDRVFPVEGPGSVIGHYKPLEEIGEGGMGVVYLAQQERPVRRKVALKIIKLGMDTREVIARFEAERQALAIMDHVNVARVLDAGTTEMGRPYFVMEHIPGKPITEYCDEQRLNAEERLNLFIPVCNAIHHAHQKGIIHRDIKPSNVLVTVQDGKPVPKVIDFGVAKAVNQRLTEKTIFTEQGVLIGTPVYMSPEQADATGRNVDTTTDVYSLGVLLYELLAGVPPFDPKSLREAGFEALHQVIREVEPPKPSTRFSELGEEGTTVAERRRTEPAMLEKQIRGELDWITMRAMEKDRSRRYQSASEFAADIQRYLQDEPVEAGPPSRIYRMRKFMRRHKAGVGLAAAAVLILIAFAATMTIQADRIARERDRAQFEAARSRAEAELLQMIFLDGANFVEAESIEQSARRLRESWELHRRSQFRHPDELALYTVNLLVLNDLSLAFGRGEGMAALELRDQLYSEALRLIEGAIAAGDTSIANTLDLLTAFFEEGAVTTGLVDLEGHTLKLYRGAVEIRRKMYPPGARELNRHLESFAQFLIRTGRRALDDGRLSDAEAYFRELHEVRLEIHPQGSHPNAIAEGLLGETLTRLGRYDEAEPFLLKSLEMYETRDARLRLIAMYESWGKPAEASRYRRDLWIDSVRELGPIGTLESNGLSLRSSCYFMDRSIWIFGGGGTRRPNRWAWSDDTNTSDGLRLYEPANNPGGRDLLPLTPEEREFNEKHSTVPRKHWELRPGAAVADSERGRALVVYAKIRDEEWVDPRRTCAGYSIAVWSHPDSAVIRPVLRPESEYPTLLFPGDTPDFGAGAVADGGYLYLYGASSAGFLDSGAIVARAPLPEVLDRSAWRYFAGDGQWVDDLNLAVRVVSGVWELSVHWNEYIGKFLAVYTASPFGSGVSMRMADRPEGPWSTARLITDGVRQAQDYRNNSGAHAHPVIAREGGRVEYITYGRPVGKFGESEVRLVEITFR
jgi:serine/threonine protein kinase